jgi:hypothetical protein
MMPMMPKPSAELGYLIGSDKNVPMYYWTSPIEGACWVATETLNRYKIRRLTVPVFELWLLDSSFVHTALKAAPKDNNYFPRLCSLLQPHCACFTCPQRSFLLLPGDLLVQTPIGSTCDRFRDGLVLRHNRYYTIAGFQP